ncbi:unnamed protein product [Pseudo-nitzschia multistriata]|uniref:ERCC1-like central domain-containing protein n=1 Tax=Pseudo-nitzschia multistriata TaxID=183589 RepID=A0A448Z4H7_9STRA|nr:unnamed protein product [Pseudo-nitzschia multistriata]
MRPGTFSQAFDSIDGSENFRRASDSFEDPKKKKQTFRLAKVPKEGKRQQKLTSKKKAKSSNTESKKTLPLSSSLSNRDGAAGTGGRQEHQTSKSRGNDDSEEQSINANAETTGNSNGNKDDLRVHHTMLQPHVLYVSIRQKGNSILPLIRNVPIAYSPMVPDYILGPTVCALFLSIKYHKLYPRYIYRRLSELRDDFKLRILLVLVDVDDNSNSLLQLNTFGVQNQLTLILCWSELEAARYLETYKVREGKDAGCIQKRESTNPIDQAADFLCATTNGRINKTDAGNLWAQFSTIGGIASATSDELALVPGMGPLKVKRLHEAFHKPFSSKRTRLKQKKRLEQLSGN